MRIKDYEDKIKHHLLTSIEDMNGRTVMMATVTYNGAVIKFTDETFMSLGTDWWDEESTKIIAETDLKAMQDETTLVEFGPLTKEEYDHYQKLKRKSQEDSYRAWKKQQIEYWKKEIEKYEGHSKDT